MKKFLFTSISIFAFAATPASALDPLQPAPSAPADECDAVLAGGEWQPDFEAPAVPPATPAPGTTPATPEPGTTPTTQEAPGGSTPNPVPTPAPAPAPKPAPQPSGGPYLTAPNPNSTQRIESKNAPVVYYRGTYVGATVRQNLPMVKQYSGPTTGIISTIGGQPIAVSKSSINVTNLHSSMVNIIDELHLTSAALGLAKPVITSGKEGQHSSTSLHASGKALDLRCREAVPCKKWAMTLKNALGRGYDVMWEDWGGPNNHIHIEYDGSA